ncbi:MAG: histidine phosphatase family protein [Acidimicrobiales bacterium]|nr:histidine phosphatase family protein [Acidimicrobiales bacterium]MBO0892823.1 histidine phosphatase family protein [Acidimicrobiales bacterium]
MPILLVRHAKAGHRSRWEGDDDERPLSRRGHQQARKLARLLAPYRPRRLVSSPYVRCVQTLAPLAAATGLVIEEHPDLGEGTGNASVSLVRALAGETAALCTHGDIVPEVLKALVAEDEMCLGSEPHWAKGSTWVLETAAGRFVEARYLAAPGDPQRP